MEIQDKSACNLKFLLWCKLNWKLNAKRMVGWLCFMVYKSL